MRCVSLVSSAVSKLRNASVNAHFVSQELRCLSMCKLALVRFIVLLIKKGDFYCVRDFENEVLENVIPI